MSYPAQTTLADGQLAASIGTILDVGPDARTVNILLANTSGSTTETVVLTLTRASGTARRVGRYSLAPNETMHIRNLPLEASDVLSASTTNATTVDYVVNRSVGGEFGVVGYDSAGAVKTVSSAISGNQSISGTLDVTGAATLSSTLDVTGDATLAAGLVLSDIGTVAAAGSVQGDATAIANRVTYVTASDGAKGVVLPAAAATRGIYFVYNTVATSGLLIYPASGDDINDGSANAAITIEGKTLAILVALDASTWAAVYTADS